MKTRSTADNGNNLRVIRHSRSEENHSYENQNRHKGDDQIYHPVRIEIDQELRYRKSVGFNSGCFRLHIDDQYNNR